MSILDRALRMGEAKKFKSYEKRVGRISAFEPELEHYDDDELRERADALRERARNGESLDDLLPECFALVREAGKRTMGMRHFDVQLIGGMVLHDGAIAEMRTGEGKTLTATLAVVLNALAGRGVHVVTVNDYLARRDAEWMRPIYDVLGLTVGVLQNMQPYEEKRAAYAADVTYGTNSEFGFDYLRDNMAHVAGGEGPARRPARARGRQVAATTPSRIVDEVDNILIDEARTPLIISGAPEQAADLYAQVRPARAADAARQDAGGHGPAHARRSSSPTSTTSSTRSTRPSRSPSAASPRPSASSASTTSTAPRTARWSTTCIQSLKAESLYKRDVDYAVIDGEVKIIDEFTGRILEGRRWSEGLHQAVEAKEGVRVQEENQTLATITLQNYFRMYDKLAGHDRHGAHRGDRVHEDLQAPRRPDPDEPADGPRGPQRPGLQDQGRQVGAPSCARSRRATTPASRCSSARSRSRSPSCSSEQLRRTGHHAHGAQRQARARRARGRDRSPRRGARARSRSPPTWPAAASTSSSAATPST